MINKGRNCFFADLVARVTGLGFFCLSLIGLGCSSQSVLPEKSEIKTSRTVPSSECSLIGKVTGNSLSVKATPEMVLDNMKQEAANKGANYLVVEQYSASGTSVTGQAYRCP
ncbi:MAG: DUF4156 domain-containing protein [Bdellovibrionales bacterium]|nr:DUF4156 domain-containing protein [Bdellovibrionales bacterium]